MDGADESGRRPGLRLLWVSGLMGFLLCNWVDGFENLNVTKHQFMDGYGFSTPPLMVGLSLIAGAASTGAVCLDGTLPGYHLHRGYGSGANSWLIHLENAVRWGVLGTLLAHKTLLFYSTTGALTDVVGHLDDFVGTSFLGGLFKGGGWCNTIRTCVFRKKTPHGSSTHMEKLIPFTGILSNRAEENPDFYNWNRVKLRYCDGASFSGDSQNEAKTLYFRGQRIWLAAMKDLMSKGMHYANQVAFIMQCSSIYCLDSCRDVCIHVPGSSFWMLSWGLSSYTALIDVSGGRTLRHMFGAWSDYSKWGKCCHRLCTSHLNPTLWEIDDLDEQVMHLSFFSSDQILASLAPHSADPRGYWQKCRLNYAYCSSSQIQVLQGDFRKQMLNAGIAQSVGDWYFDRAEVKSIDCPYPCDKTCHNLVFRQRKMRRVPEASGRESEREDGDRQKKGFSGHAAAASASHSERVLQGGMEAPVTAGLLAANTLIYLRPSFIDSMLPTIDKVWFNPHLILKALKLMPFDGFLKWAWVSVTIDAK
ncbi:Pectin acetylesterase 12 [Vitis vinifera]|uniref:Pectin acetylesterase n=1 Tax=Vitis vinifera TaxID=29760 RepID=A0A438F6H0_VITVI|nr:Pectin acetylesterase 12 [Vitis vinifera]